MKTKIKLLSLYLIICLISIVSITALDISSPNITIIRPLNNSKINTSDVLFQYNLSDYNYEDLSSTLVYSLVAYYSLDNNSDMTGNGLDLLNGSGSYGPGKVGNALSGSYIYGQGNQFSKINGNYTDGNNITMCLWTNATTDGGTYGVAGTNVVIGDFIDRGGVGGGHFTSWQWFSGGGALSGDGVSYGAGRSGWHYHCILRNQTGLYYYFDNSMVASDQSFLNPVWNASIVEFLVGAYTSAGSFPWDGQIDEVGIWNRALTETEISTLYNSGNGISYSTITQSSINITNGSGLANSTIYVYNESDYLVNQTLITSFTDTNSTTVNLTIFLSDGYYDWFADAYDNSNNYSVTENYTFLVDGTFPLISYSSDTPIDGSNKSQNYVYVNVTLTEPFLSNITYNLFSYNKNLINKTVYTQPITNITWYSLSESVYYYNVTVCDQTNKCNYTETRKITLDTSSPNITIVQPLNNSYISNNTFNIEYNITEGVSSAISTLLIDLVAYYSLDNNSDVTGNGLDLNNRTGTYAAGKIGNALAGDWIYGQGSIFSKINTNYTSDISMCVWTYGSTAGGSYGIAGTTENIGDQIDRGGIGGGYFSSWQFFSGGGALSGDGTIYINSRSGWHYSCAIRNQSGLYYYFDNSIVASDQSFLNPNWKATVKELVVGAYQNNGALTWPDLIDELGIWNRQLTNDEISTLYNNGTGIGYSNFSGSTTTSNNGSGISNSTIYIYNNSDSLLNQTTTSSFTDLFNTVVNIPFYLIDGIYKWFAIAVDFASNEYVTQNNSFVIDTIFPTVSYGSGNYDNYANISSHNIFVNVTDISVNVNNITYNLYLLSINNFCYQEFANVSTSCGGLNTGVYSWSSNWFYPNNMFDGDYSTNSSTNGTGVYELYVNYTRPTNALLGSYLYVNTTSISTPTMNLVIPSSCWTDPVRFYITTTESPPQFFRVRCLDQFDNLITLINMPTGILKEEAMYWNITSNYPILNQTVTSPSQTSLTWYGLPDGAYYYNVNVTSFGNQKNGTSYRYITLDNTKPVITTITPPDGSSTTSSNINFTYNGTDYGYNNITNETILGSGVINTTLWVFNVSGGLVNKTTTTILGSIFNFIVSIPMTLIEGIYTWFVDATDFALNTQISSNNTLTIDTTPPVLIIISPTNTTYTEGFITALNTTMNITWNLTDGLSGPGYCWYYLDLNSRVYVPCHQNITYIGIDYGQHNLTFYANDTAGNEVNQSVIATWKYVMRTNSINFNPTAYELASEQFIFNTTLDPSITGITMGLIYNNTNYISNIINSGLNTLFTNTIITPPISQPTNISFYWNFTASDGIYTYNIISQTYNQTINPIVIGLCNATLTDIIYNFTAQDEDTLLRIRPFYFGGTFGYSINGTNKKEVTISQISDEVDICYNLPSLPINLNVYVTYDEDENLTQIYNTRNFVLQNHLKYSTTDQINLTLLNDTRSTTFILKVQDNDLVPLANYVINTYRRDPSSGTFYLTQSGKTDSNGLTSGFFEINTVDYYFVITYNDEVKLITSPPQKVIPQTTPYTLVFTINAGGISPFLSLINITDLNLTFFNTSVGMSMNYRDSSNNFTNARFVVYRINYSGQNILVCNITSPLVTDTLSCNFNGINGSYTGIAYLTRNDIESFVSSINTIFPNDGRGWGLYGVFLGLLIIMCCSFMFRYNEIAGIWLVTLAIIFINIIGFINFGVTFITATIVIAIILTVVMKQ